MRKVIEYEMSYFFFFFQAEDGIRDIGVTGVQDVCSSDLIHADLIYDGRTHIPMGSLSPEIAARTITITSATKSFNIPGLRCSVMHFGSAELRDRFHKRIPPRMLGQVNVVGIDATVAAWRHAQPWLDAVMVRLAANRERVARFAASEILGIRHYAPE